MVLKIRTLSRALAAPTKKQVSDVLDLDLAAMANAFMYKFYNQPSPAYGHWVTPEMWAHLNPYGHTRGQGYFHPSSGLTWATTGCVRNVILDLLCAPRSKQRIDAKLAKILDNGTNRHTGLHVLFLGMAHYKWMGVESYKAEHRVKSHGLPIEGTVDGKIRVKGVPLILDFKTINKAGFDKLRTVSPEYAAQLATYLRLDRVDNGIVVYENKDNQEWVFPLRSMLVQAGAASWDPIKEYCTEVLEMANAYELPAFNEKTCRASITFCAYKETCDKLIKCGDSPEAIAEIDKRSDETRRKHLKVVK